MKNPYEVMGLPNDATPAEIKSVYRRMAQRLHPDKDSGDHLAFTELQEAHDILSDPERRAQFDATGSTDKAVNLRQAAEHVVPDIMMSVLSKVSSPEFVDIAHLMWQDVMGSLSTDRANHTLMLRDQARLIDLRRRFIRKNGENLITAKIDEKLTSVGINIASVAQHQLFLREVLDVLKDYEYISGVIPDPEPLQLETAHAQPV